MYIKLFLKITRALIFSKTPIWSITQIQLDAAAEQLNQAEEEMKLADAKYQEVLEIMKTIDASNPKAAPWATKLKFLAAYDAMKFHNKRLKILTKRGKRFLHISQKLLVQHT